MKRWSDTVGKAAKPITNGVNYTRRESSAGVNIIAGGMSTSSAGMTSATGTIAITTGTERRLNARVLETMGRAKGAP